MTAPRPKPRFRYSLSTLLLLTTIACLAITVALLWREVRPLREEVRRLRDEVGELYVEDPTKLHAIRVNSDNELVWKWRLWIPEGKRYKLRAEGGKVPSEGFPRSGGTTYLITPGETVVEYRIVKDPRSDSWRGSLHAQGSSVGADFHPWVDWPSRSSTGGGVGTSTKMFEPGETAVLERKRVGQVRSSSNIPNPAEGFMVWIEPN